MSSENTRVLDCQTKELGIILEAREGPVGREGDLRRVGEKDLFADRGRLGGHR